MTIPPLVPLSRPVITALGSAILCNCQEKEKLIIKLEMCSTFSQAAGNVKIVAIPPYHSVLGGETSVERLKDDFSKLVQKWKINQ